MPVHDWTLVNAGLFHDFHQTWTVALRNALNAGVLPPKNFAVVEQSARGPIADVPTTKSGPGAESPSNEIQYAARANRITVRHQDGDVVAAIEIISPGNKGSRSELRAFVDKSAALVRQGVHLLVVDLFPPDKYDPHGLHKAIWDEFQEVDFDLPPNKPLTVVSYDAGPTCAAYADFIAVGDALPDMPLFLKPEMYVPAPLEKTYQETWELFPGVLENLLTRPTD